MKKFIAILISIVMLMNLIPMAASASSDNYVEVTKDSAPVRSTYYETGDVCRWVSYGTTLRVVDTTINSHLNTWFKVEYDTNRYGWIWSGNVKTHQHNYYKVNYNGNTFGICQKCYTISVERVSTVEVNKMDSAALAIPLVLGACDGLLPIGDVVGVLLVSVAMLEMGQSVTTTQIREMVDTMDLRDYTKGINSCGVESFYKVQPVGNSLQKLDSRCLNVLQAFVCSRFMGINVWTETQAAAMACASMNGYFYGPERDYDQPGYWYHFHYGRDKNHKETRTHIFFGTNDYGQRPQ